MRIALSASQRAGGSQPAPSVRLANPKRAPPGVQRASRAISADFVNPCRSSTAS